jgi:hypothetical protein
MSASKAVQPASPVLSVYRQLDPKRTSPEFKAYIVDFEQGDPSFVSADRPRDYVWTDEIVHATTGYALVDASGGVLARFDSLDKAEAAKASARIVFDVAIDAEDED